MRRGSAPNCPSACDSPPDRTGRSSSWRACHQRLGVASGFAILGQIPPCPAPRAPAPSLDLPSTPTTPTDMLRLAAVSRPLRCAVSGSVASRCIATTTAVPQRTAGSPLPWFMDPADVAPKRPQRQPRHVLPLAPLPAAISPESAIGRLHATLSTSPHLEPGTLLVREPISTANGPPIPQAVPKGRRNRGRTYAGEGIPDPGAGIWNWIVVAQVCAPALRSTQ